MFYAVAKGHRTGIVESWPECQEMVNGFSRPRFKKFPTRVEAEEWMCKNGQVVNDIDPFKKKNWKPIEGQEYYYPNFENHSLYGQYDWKGDSVDEFLHKLNLVFETSDEAIAVAKLMLEKR